MRQLPCGMRHTAGWKMGIAESSCFIKVAHLAVKAAGDFLWESLLMMAQRLLRIRVGGVAGHCAGNSKESTKNKIRSLKNQRSEFYYLLLLCREIPIFGKGYCAISMQKGIIQTIFPFARQARPKPVLFAGRFACNARRRSRQAGYRIPIALTKGFGQYGYNLRFFASADGGTSPHRALRRGIPAHEGIQADSFP